MKKITTKFLVSLLMIVVLSSCKDVFDNEDIQKNPNAPSDAPYDVLTSGTLLGLAELYESTDVRIAYMWAGQLTGLSRQHLTLAQYQVSSGTFDWGNYYNVAANARLIQEKADAVNNPWPKGVAQVIEALVLAELTDLYGDIPYSQAFDVEKYPTPVFDKQADVYAKLLTVLDDAIANMQKPVGSLSDLFESSYDFVYHGDLDKWTAAAYTLKARLYLHLQKYPEAIAAATLGIGSTGGDALIPHGTSYTVDFNLNYSFFDFNRPGDTGFSFIDLTPTFLPTLMENRKNSKTDETALFNHYFLTDGYYVEGGVDPNVADGVFTSDAPHPILTFYENQLILAEALSRQGGASLPLAVDAVNSVRAELATGYINGKIIIEDYQDLGIQYDPYVDADFLPGGLLNPVSSGRTNQTALIYEILAQKYIVMLAQYEVYSDVRRSAVASPVVTLGISPYPGTSGGIPDRYIYPQSEINTNPNVPNPLPTIHQKLPIYQ